MQYAERSGKADVREGCAAVIDVPLSLGPGKIYDLTDGGSNSDGFYLQAEAFTERVEREAEFRAASLLEEYRTFLRFATKEPARSWGEYAVELLTLGMALRTRG